MCVCVSLCFYAWFADIPTGFKKSSQEIFRQVARSLAIGPTPGLGPSQRCSGGNNFSRTYPSQRKNLVVKSTHWGHDSHPEVFQRQFKKCRCAVTDVLFPKPCWNALWKTKHFSAAIHIQQSLLKKTNATLTPGLFATNCFSRLYITCLCAIATLPFLLHLHVPFSQHFHKAKTVKGAPARQSFTANHN